MQTVNIKCYECFDCRELNNTVLYNKLPKFLCNMRYVFAMISDTHDLAFQIYTWFAFPKICQIKVVSQISCMSNQNFNTLGQVKDQLN